MRCFGLLRTYTNEAQTRDFDRGETPSRNVERLPQTLRPSRKHNQKQNTNLPNLAAANLQIDNTNAAKERIPITKLFFDVII
jgi:hypothetical protein